jgi:hypothetical protein
MTGTSSFTSAFRQSAGLRRRFGGDARRAYNTGRKGGSCDRRKPGPKVDFFQRLTLEKVDFEKK